MQTPPIPRPAYGSTATRQMTREELCGHEPGREPVVLVKPLVCSACGHRWQAPLQAPNLSPRQTIGLVVYVLGAGVFEMVLAHDVLSFGWCLGGACLACALAGGIALSPAWAGSLSGALAAMVAIALTKGWVALDGPMQLDTLQPRRFLFLAVLFVLALAPGFGLYALLRKWLGLPLLKPSQLFQQSGNRTEAE